MHIARLVLGAMACVAFFPGGAAAQGYTVATDLLYGSVETAQGPFDLKLDLYLPTNVPPPFPVVVWIHGGGWQSGSKANPTAKPLASQGYAVASIDYRLSGEATWPTQIHDCKGAVRWLRKNAALYQLDANRIGVWGSSSGGHLAAMVGTLGDVGTVTLGGQTIDLEGTTGGNTGFSSRVQAVVNWYGATDFLWFDASPCSLGDESGQCPESKLLGGPIQELPVLAASADPKTFLSRDDPPMLIVHGTADPLVPFNQSERLLVAGECGFGLDYRLVAVQNGGHGGTGFSVDEARAHFDQHLMTTPANVVLASALASSLSEAAGSSAAFRISRSGPLDDALAVRFLLAGSALEGVDVFPLGSVAVIPAGAAFLDLAVAPLNDSLIEGDESVVLQLRPSAAYRSDAAAARAVLPLVDDESAAGRPVVTVEATDGRGEEGASDDIRFRFQRSGSTAAPLTVQFRVRGSARPGADLVSPGGAVEIPAGASTADLPVSVLDDAEFEVSEYLLLDVLAAAGYALGPAASADAMIRDDEANTLPLVCVSLDRPRASEAGGPVASFLVTRFAPLTGAVQVQLAVSGSAVAGADFSPLPALVTVPSGQSTVRVQVGLLDDAAVEGDESLTVQVLPGAGYLLGLQTRRTLAVEDNEGALRSGSAFLLDVGHLRPGEPFVMSMAGPAGPQPFALFLATRPGFFEQAGAVVPFLLDSQVMLALASGVLGLDGRMAFAAVTPETPEVTGLPLYFQAATLDAGSGQVILSDRSERAVLAP